jgi:PKHD-type hydroxylase
MKLSNYFLGFNGAINKTQCKKILNLGKSKIKKLLKEKKNINAITQNSREKSKDKKQPQLDLTIEELNKKNINKDKTYVRDSQVCFLNDKWIYDIITPYLAEANKVSGWNFEYDYSEDMQFTVYKPGGFYGWHADGESDITGAYKKFIPGESPVDKNGNILPLYSKYDDWVGKVRKISMTLNLTEPEKYSGGNLKFDFGPHNHDFRYFECTESRKQGSLIFFPSFVYHTVTPVTKGTRYSLVMWVLGKPFK